MPIYDALYDYSEKTETYFGSPRARCHSRSAGFMRTSGKNELYLQPVVLCNQFGDRFGRCNDR